MTEQADKARVTFACSGCSATADEETKLAHDAKPHTQKAVRVCSKSGTRPHVLRPAKHSVTKGTKFTDTFFGFRVSKASGWIFADAKLPANTLLLICDKDAKDTVAVYVDERHSHRDADEFHQAAVAVTRALKGVEVKDEGEVDFAGGKGKRLSYTLQSEKGPRRIVQYYVKHDGSFLTLQTVDAEPFGDHDKALDEIVKSFELLK